MVGKFNGILVGYRWFDKKVKDNYGNVIGSARQYEYDVFCSGGKKDKTTGLYTDKCGVVSVVEEEQVLKELKYGVEVEFFGEAKKFKDKNGNEQSYMQYSGIEAVGK